jgi:hypothetical protein
MADIEIWRGGVTASKSTKEDNTEAAIASRLPLTGWGFDPSGLVISFKLASKGGGKSAVYVRVPLGDFEKMAEKMLEVDADAAEKAFLKSMLKKRKKRA